MSYFSFLNTSHLQYYCLVYLLYRQQSTFVVRYQLTKFKENESTLNLVQKLVDQFWPNLEKCIFLARRDIMKGDFEVYEKINLYFGQIPKFCPTFTKVFFKKLGCGCFIVTLSQNQCSRYTLEHYNDNFDIKIMDMLRMGSVQNEGDGCF